MNAQAVELKDLEALAASVEHGTPISAQSVTLINKIFNDSVKTADAEYLATTNMYYSSDLSLSGKVSRVYLNRNLIYNAWRRLSCTLKPVACPVGNSVPPITPVGNRVPPITTVPMQIDALASLYLQQGHYIEALGVPALKPVVSNFNYKVYAIERTSSLGY